ncbi:protein D2-like [Phlebotomus argentipes]|uniref:protein D2-like n=1 Tax=Phlebotomus argentipes TaxID=94469 RepID=UPI0028930CD3|nr:protein D2-like [Phlebotomus argentipes]
MQFQNLQFYPSAPSYYTLVMTDPDAGEVSEVKHWIVVNIPGNDIARGETIAEYIGPAPPNGSGLHRYVFLVYEQPDGPMQFNEPYSDDDDFSYRPFFRVQQFADQYNLGTPVAGNFFLAAWDESVPALRARLGLN